MPFDDPARPAELPRETILFRGGASLPDADLLALILGVGTRRQNVRDLARSLLGETGGLRSLAARGAREMMAFRGIGPARAARLLALFSLAKRLHEARLAPGSALRSSRDVFDHFHLRLRDLKKEMFIVLLLDSKHKVIREERISEGSLTASIVHPREVFKPAVAEQAGAIVAVHNHPSGDPTPSSEDYDITRRLKEVGDLMGIPLLDHVVLGDGTFVSFREDRLVPW